MPDYIIVGQGICGTFLSYYLQKEGKSVVVIDNALRNSASTIASGIINPVTGRRIVKTWLIDDVLPFARQAYNEVGHLLRQNIIKPCNVLDFFATPQMQESFTNRIKEEPELLQLQNDIRNLQSYFRFNYGVGKIHPCYLTDVQALLSLWKNELKKRDALLEESFDWQYCNISEKSFIQYKDIFAEKIIFCDGVAGAINPHFQLLPFAFNKGEALIVNIPGLPQTNIYKQGITIVPWREKDMFWTGSNYVWDYTDIEPTNQFREKTEAQLQYWLKLPFTVVDHVASERPANIERRPFVGLHPLHPNLGILNGMGTKGCSLAPFFAHQFTRHLLYNEPLEPLADVKRFTRILSR